eukprot:CAMPEP_0172592610 /NCGR_PEP_ID=MMETSP1068-20121228/11629_1 /TAXON_ID=35684 /ORGANISM="Pseudopedinella elastica, Strain CCMP716" /LENGTH=107 /DNA_ID=CAMNT_0013389689 /DNA_START=68 /DNA_END=391 /DNA_ORIENTATION=-
MTPTSNSASDNFAASALVFTWALRSPASRFAAALAAPASRPSSRLRCVCETCVETLSCRCRVAPFTSESDPAFTALSAAWELAAAGRTRLRSYGYCSLASSATLLSR